MEYNIVQIKCKNPECDNTFKCKIPKQTGIYTVKCPKCGKAHRIRIQEKEIKVNEPQTTDTPNHQQTYVPDNFNEQGSTSSEKQGKTRDLESGGKSCKGCIIVIRRFGLSRKKYPLQIGRNTIGRYDEEVHSDIEINNDAYMSRRSIVIEVTTVGNEFLFKLSVLNATNAVLHNERALTVGESLYLNYGDSIRLGHTLLKFEKSR